MGEWLIVDDGIKNFILLEYQKLFETKLLLSTYSLEVDSFACYFLFDKGRISLSTLVSKEEIR